MRGIAPAEHGVDNAVHQSIEATIGRGGRSHGFELSMGRATPISLA